MNIRNILHTMQDFYGTEILNTLIEEMTADKIKLFCDFEIPIEPVYNIPQEVIIWPSKTLRAGDPSNNYDPNRQVRPPPARKYLDAIIEIRYYHSNVVILPFKTGAELANLLIRKYPYSITREALIKHVSKQLAELKKAKDH
jgi:hypothetical protein